MSTTSRNRTRARGPYDPSPSPDRSRRSHSPTLVASRSPSESTISLPRYNTSGAGAGAYHSYQWERSFERGEPDAQHAHRAHDSIAKLSIAFGVFTVIAGVMSLKKSKDARKRARLQEEYEAARRRDSRRGRDRGYSSRSSNWASSREEGYRGRIWPGESRREPLRIEGPPRSRTERGGGNNKYGSDAGRSRR